MYVLLAFNGIVEPPSDLSKYDLIPSVGLAGRFTSYISAFRFVSSSREMLRTGYEKYPNSFFKVATVERWEIVVSGAKLVNDMWRAKDNELSFHVASSDVSNVYPNYPKLSH